MPKLCSLICLSDDYYSEVAFMRHERKDVNLSDFTDEELEIVKKFLSKIPGYHSGILDFEIFGF